MPTETLLLPTGALTLAALIVAGAASLLPWLKTKTQGYPLEAEIEAALLPVIYQAICAAYRVSEWAIDECGQRLRGLDKKQIADQVYSLLPDMVGRFPLYLVKQLITRERFAVLVQNAFDHFDAHFLTFFQHYQNSFEEWKTNYGYRLP